MVVAEANRAIIYIEMKYFLLISILFFTQLSASGQYGYSKVYDFDRPGISFLNINILNDTLLVFGPTYHDSIPNLQGLFFAQLDTLGNLLSFHTYFDSLGGDLTARPHCTIHKLNDGSGYVIPAGSFTRSTGILCFLNSEGDFTKIVEYSDNTSQTEIYNTLIETDNGLLLLGTKSRLDFLIDVFIMKIDKFGNKLWEKYYDSPGRQWYYGGCFQENENSLVIGISDIDPQNTPMSQWKRKGILLAVDTLGEEKWRWESETSLLHAGLGTPVKRPDGNWMYSTAEIQIYPSSNFASNNTKVVVRDINFNLVSERILSPSYSEANGFVDIQPTQDGNWIGFGSMTTPPLWTQPNALAGWMYKFNNNLDSIWSREDTVFYNFQTYTDHWLHGAVQLPSGSIIAAGQINVYYPSPGKSWGWIIKVSKDGCIDTLACSVSAVKDWKNHTEADVRVFPNPTNGLLYFNDITIKWDKIEIINAQGQVMKVINKPNETEVNLTEMSAGMYMIRFVRKGESIVRCVFKI